MSIKKANILILLMFILGVSQAKPFKLKDVRVLGLQRITASSFFNYMPVKRGAIIKDADYPNIIRELHKTGFFKNVKISRDGNVLVIEVEERKVIGEINLNGNKDINDKKLLKILTSLGLGEGDAFDETKLSWIKRELFNLYNAKSKFDVIIDASTRSLGNNRIALDIDIKEGVSARIKQINIIGNKAFSEKEILDKIELSTPKWHSLLTKKDRYSGEQLKADVEAIEKYYYDRGYLDFRINSTQVSLTDDKKYIYITISIKEGLPYRIDKNIFPESKLLSKKQLNDLLEYGIGDYYSRSNVRKSQDNIKNVLGEKGYAFAEVRVSPKLDKTHKRATLIYDILLGRKTYVRRISFTGNYHTNDNVLRREIRQMESSVYNSTKLTRSAERIKKLSYIRSVKRVEVPVPGKPDQVDIIYEVGETTGRSFSIGFGYGSESKLSFDSSYNNANFLGTGNILKFNISASKSEKNYGLTFTDPYFTPDGISRTVQMYYNKTDESENNIGDWASDNLGAALRFGIPINEYESYSLGVAYRNTKIKTGKSVSPEIPYWLDKHGDKFDEFVLDFNWTHDTTDDLILPTKGAITRLNAEVVVPGSDETYYKLNVRNRTYFKLSDKLLLSARGDISYGDGYGKTEGIPFYRSYYAGGLTTVRGFKSNSLGPRWLNGSIKGGDFRVVGGGELILPWKLGQKKEVVRLALFTDFGNVYNSIDDFDASEFRYSAGAYLLWNSPIGPLNISYAIPLNEKKGDQIERFQFTIGVPL